MQITNDDSSLPGRIRREGREATKLIYLNKSNVFRQVVVLCTESQHFEARRAPQATLGESKCRVEDQRGPKLDKKSSKSEQVCKSWLKFCFWKRHRFTSVKYNAKSTKVDFPSAYSRPSLGSENTVKYNANQRKLIFQAPPPDPPWEAEYCKIQCKMSESGLFKRLLQSFSGELEYCKIQWFWLLRGFVVRCLNVISSAKTL